MKTRKTIKRNIKTDIIAVIIMVAIIFGVLRVLPVLLEPKTPATAEQVISALVSQGYTPRDYTEAYIANNPGVEETLNELIAVEQDDMRFEFYNFTRSDHATRIYSHSYSELIRKYNSLPRVQTNSRRANYSIYTLEASGMYAVAIYVGNTAVYAYSNAESEHAAKIRRVLTEIGYFEQGSNMNTETENIIIRAILVITSLLLMIATRIRYRWLKTTAIQQPKNASKLLALHKALNAPSVVCTILAIITCFTDTLIKAVNYSLYIVIALLVISPAIRLIVKNKLPPKD
ncbi:MAG: hypothetical protein FWG87_04210 [Defluviitaleaceae bacterium]|nr:hypothetical protein [Defluviitaleaceae bacterium]